MNTILLAVLLSAACPARAEYGAPRLRIVALEGELRVRVKDSLAYSMRGPVTMSADELEFWPGTVVEVVSGRAVFESDVHARVIAPGGSMFRVSMAENRGLRVTSLPGTLPVTVRVGDLELAVWQGGSLSVHDGGRIDVENAGVYRVPGGLRGEGEDLAAMLAETGISLTEGDSLSLDLPRGRGFPARQAVTPLLAANLPDLELRDALTPSPPVTRVPKAPVPASGRAQAGGAVVMALIVAGAAVAARNLL